MKRIALAIALMLLPLAAAASGPSGRPSPYGPIHIERQRGPILTIEHTPVGRRAVRRVHRAKVLAKHRVRRAKVAARRKVRRTRLVREGSEFIRHPAIAGGCWDGGYVRRRVAGYGRVTLEREVCDGIAPVSSLPRGMAYVPQGIDFRALERAIAPPPARVRRARSRPAH